MSAQQWGRGGRAPSPRYPPAGFGGPQPGVPPYGPVFREPQPVRRNPLKLLLLAMIAVGGLALGSLVVAGWTTSPAASAYANDDYQVPPPDTNPPPLPVPTTYREARRTIEQSPFYAQSVPAPVRCDTLPINVAAASDAQLQTHLDDMMACLVRVWEPPITAANFVLVRPSVTIFGSRTTTKCGTSDVNAFYCAADQQVYFSDRLAQTVPIVQRDRWAADVVIAHEFGHALQARTGILVSAKALGQDAGDESTDLLYSRRLETQADCFSGMFIRSVSTSLGVGQPDLTGIEATYRAVGDDTLSGNLGIVGNHGRASSQSFWGTTGLGTASVAACNTFAAPASRVR